MGEMSQHPLTEQWCQAIVTGDLQQVLALYEEDALLRPTLSPHLRCGLAAIANYFAGDKQHQGFLQRGIKQIHHQVEQELYLDHALVLMGQYEFIGPDETVKANFTFVLKESGTGFKILAHHSSLRYEEA